jgi:UDP-N-acetylmuramyl tripeptide synthase
MRFKIELFIAKIIVFLINIINPKKGTSFPGRIINKIDKAFIGKFEGIDFNKVVFVTGTNGKSTLTNLLYHILKKNGVRVVANLEGANQKCGIATTLIKNSTLSGRVKHEYFVFEIDERSLYQIYPYIKAKHVVITNIQKDQVQRNGDPDYIIRKLSQVINPDMTLYLNNEEPRSKYFESKSDDIIYFGVDKNSLSYQKTGIFDISMPCPVCGRKVEFNYLNIDNIGNFYCPTCNFSSEKIPNVLLADIDFEIGRFYINNQIFEMPYNVPFMLYNYAGAAAIALNLGFKIENISAAFTSFINIGGRIESIRHHKKDIKYIRIKQENPETFQSALDSVANDSTEKIFVLGLNEIVDFYPHYTNTFYAYDCDLTKLVNSNVKKYICFSQYVCYDTALRFIYEGIDKEDIIILPTQDVKTLLDEIDKIECDNIYLITWLKTFNQIKEYIREESKQ